MFIFKLLIIILFFLIVLRIEGLLRTIIGGIKFIPYNRTLKWIIIFCVSYLFYFISYIFLYDVPLLPLFQYAFRNWILIETFNVIRLFFYLPISRKVFTWIFYKLERLPFKIMEFIGTSMLVIEMIFIIGLEIIIISFGVSYEYVRTTDIIFNDKIFTAYLILTVGIGIYAALTGSGLILLQMANYRDVSWDRGKFNYSARTGSIAFITILIFTGIFIKNIAIKNDFYGNLNTTSELDAAEIVKVFNQFESKANDHLLMSENNKGVSNGKKGVSPKIYSIEEINENAEEIYTNDPISGLQSLFFITGELLNNGKYHKAEVEFLRAVYHLKESYSDYNYNDLNIYKNQYIADLFDDLQFNLFASITWQRVGSDVALDLYRDLISLDEQTIMKENSIDYLYGSRRTYEAGFYYLYTFINKKPENMELINNDLVQLIERNKARKFNRSLDAKWIEESPVLADGKCGLNYICSINQNYILGQFYDSDTTISFTVKEGIFEKIKNITEQIKSLSLNPSFKDSLQNWIIPKNIRERLKQKDLLISTDAYLQDIPPQYLLSGLTLKSITLIPSFTSLVSGKNENRIINSICFTSNSKPDLYQSKNVKGVSDLDSLYFADIEVDNISEIFQDIVDSSVTMKSVSETWIKENAHLYDLIHFAAHSDQHGLYLNKDKFNDGILSNEEIRREITLNGQTIFLSSCEGAKGEYQYGEGISSIAKSFLDAGAGGVVASLWKLNDKKGSELVYSFYDEYSKNRDISKSLYDSQNNFNSLYPKFKYPFVYITY